MRSDAQLLLIDKQAVERLLRPDDVIAAVREAFELHSLAQAPTLHFFFSSIASRTAHANAPHL